MVKNICLYCPCHDQKMRSRQKYLVFVASYTVGGFSNISSKYLFLLPPSLIANPNPNVSSITCVLVAPYHGLKSSHCLVQIMCFCCRHHCCKMSRCIFKNMCFCCSNYGWKTSQHLSKKHPVVGRWNGGLSLDNRLLHLLTWRSARIIIVTWHLL